MQRKAVFPIGEPSRQRRRRGRHEDHTECSQARHETSLHQLEQNLKRFAIFGDNNCHPLQAFLGWTDVTGNQKTAEKIHEQVQQINAVIYRLDRGALESDTIRKSVSKHHAAYRVHQPG